MTSSVSERSPKMESAFSPEPQTSTDQTETPYVEVRSSRREPNPKPDEQVLMDELSTTVSIIDHVVSDLVEDHETSESHTEATETITDSNERSNPGTEETPNIAPLPSNPLDFSILDSGNKPCLSPVGKTFLNSYSHNYSQLLQENAELSLQGCEELPGMYKMLNESDSETDSSAKNKTSQDCENPQDTESEEEVELCYSPVSDPQSNQSESSASPKQEISSDQAAQVLLKHLSRSPIYQDPPNPDSNGVSEKDDATCDLHTTSSSETSGSKPESIEKISPPDSGLVSSNPAFFSDSTRAESPLTEQEEKINSLSGPHYTAPRDTEGTDTPVSPVISSRHGHQGDAPSTSSKLKGLSIKGKYDGSVRSPGSPIPSKRLTSADNTITSCLKKTSIQNSTNAGTRTQQNGNQTSDSTKPERTETTSKQRTFIEVRLSTSITSPVPVLTCRESSSSNNPVPKDNQLHDWSAPKLTSQAHNIPKSDTCVSNKSPEPNNGFERTTKATETTNYKAGKSKLYHRILDRRSYSTGAQDPRSFSVRQRIKSFENLASFGPVMRCIDIHSYAVTSKTPLDRRRSDISSFAGTRSTDSRSLKRSLSSCTNTTNSYPSLQPQNSISGLTEPATGLTTQTTGPQPGRPTPTQDTVSQPDSGVRTPVVMRSRNARASNGISRSRLRELRALSMPELDKLCPEDFSQDPGNATFKTELEIHPAGQTTCTAVTRTGTVDPGMMKTIPNGDRDQTQTGGDLSWSMR